MALKFFKKDVSKLIRLYRERPLLWDITNKNYSKAALKKKATEEIAAKMGLPVEVVKKKWKYLRNAYAYEKKKVDASRRFSSADDVVYEPRLSYYVEMSFLNSSIIPRFPLDCIEREELSQNYDTTLSNEEIPISDDELAYEMDHTYYDKDSCRNNSTIKRSPPADYKTKESSSAIKRASLHDEDYNEDRSKHQQYTVEIEKLEPPTKIDEVQKRTLGGQMGYRKRDFTDEADLYAERQLKDEAAVYAQGWACSFRKMSSAQQIYAKQAIDEILVHGRLDELKLDFLKPLMCSTDDDNQKVNGKRKYRTERDKWDNS